jgi:hypothetical protein
VPVPAYNEDGDATNFSAAEQTDITNIWAWASEKYSPFKVNVTTVDPGNEDVRVLIGGSANDWLNQSAGGIANIGGYDGPNNTCFAFSGDVTTGPSAYAGARLWQFVGETCAHEAGHEWGLKHETWPAPPGGNPQYYPGDGNESPIMGGSSNSVSGRGIWWKTNVYPGQNSTQPIQDELGVLTSPAPLTYRALEAGGTLSIDGTGAVTPANGLITHTSDVAPFDFSPPTTAAAFTITNNQFGGMLAPDATVQDINGNVVPSSVSVSNTGCSVTCNNLIAGHPYFLEVTSQGGYGDIGQFTVKGQMQVFAGYNAATRTVSVGGLAGNNTIDVSIGGTNQLEISDGNGSSTGFQTFALNAVDHISIFLGDGNHSITVHPLQQQSTGVNVGPSVTASAGAGNSTISLDKSFNNEPVGGFVINSNSQITMVTTAVAFFGFNRVELHGALEVNQTYAIHSWNGFNGPTGLYIYANGSSDTVSLDQAVVNDYGRDIYVIGGGNGTVSLVMPTDDVYQRIDPEGSETLAAPFTSIVQFGPNDWTVQWTVDGSQRFIHFDANVTSVSLTGGAGNDNYNIQDLPSSTTLGITERGGDNNLFVGFYDPDNRLNDSDPFSDGVKGNINYSGGSHSMNIVVDDRAHSGSLTYTVGNDNLKTSISGTISYPFGDISGVSLLGSLTSGDTFNISSGAGFPLTVAGGAGNDTFAATSSFYYSPSGAGLTMSGNGGNDTMTVDDHSGLGVFSETDIYSDHIDRFGNTPPGGNSIAFSGMSSVTYDVDHTAHTVNVWSAPALGNQFTLVGTTSDDVFTIHPRNAAGNSTILGNIGVFGNGGTDAINITDDLAPFGATWNISNPSGSSIEDFTIGGGAFIGAFQDIGAINLNGSPGGNTFNVNQFRDGASLNIFGGAGDDACYFGNDNLPANLTSISQFTFDGQAGSNTFNLYDSNDGTGTYAGSVGSVSYTSSSGNYFIGPSVLNTQLTQFFPAQNGPVVRIIGVAPGTTTSIHAGANTHPDLLQVGNTVVSGIQGAIIFDGGVSGSSITVNDSNDLTTRTVHLTQNRLGVLPGDNFFPAGGSLTFTNIMAGLTLNMPGRPNTLYAQPNASGTVSIVGGFSSTMVLALAAAVNPVIHGTASSGSVTSDNLKTLSWTFLKALPTVDAVAPQIIGWQFNPGGGPGAFPAGLNPTLVATFSEQLVGDPGAAALQQINLSGAGGSVTATNYDPASNTETFTFGNGLPPGIFLSTLPMGTVYDVAGNTAGTSSYSYLYVPASGFLALPISSKTIRVQQVSIGAGGEFDLNNGAMIVDYTGSSPAAALAGLLASGFDNGAWNGPGIASSAAANDGAAMHGLGYAEASDLGVNSFMGQSIDGTAVLIRYTNYGDNNLDGVVDIGNDFGLFLDGIAASGSSWVQGDYTYDGRVDFGNDFNLFLPSYLNSIAKPAAKTVAPTPVVAGAPPPKIVSTAGLPVAGSDGEIFASLDGIF